MNRLVPVPLVALSLVPLAAGALRLVQLAGGPDLMPADDRFPAVPVALVAHIVGATVYATLQDMVMRETEYWRAMLGAVILILVLAFPEGIVGGLARLLPARRA